jgi:hypothetical protein
LWNQQGADDVPLFLQKKRRRLYCFIRLWGNGTGMVAFDYFASISSVTNSASRSANILRGDFRGCPFQNE